MLTNEDPAAFSASMIAEPAAAAIEEQGLGRSNKCSKGKTEDTNIGVWKVRGPRRRPNGRCCI